MCQRSCETRSLSGGGWDWRWRVCNLVACEGSDAAPSRLSTWLEVLIQLSLLDHHYIGSAGRRAGTPTGSIQARASPSFTGALTRISIPHTFNTGTEAEYHQIRASTYKICFSSFQILDNICKMLKFISIHKFKCLQSPHLSLHPKHYAVKHIVALIEW